MSTEIKVSKLDAARRQIDTAIRLYFNDQDSLSIHSLACAGHEILNTIGKTRGITSIKDAVLDSVVPSYKKTATKKLNEAKNFLKHADKDPDGFLEFNPNVTELFLYDCCLLHKNITGEMTTLMKSMKVWYLMRNPKSSSNTKNVDFTKEPWYTLNKIEFLKNSLEMLNKIS